MGVPLFQKGVILFILLNKKEENTIIFRIIIKRRMRVWNKGTRI